MTDALAQLLTELEALGAQDAHAPDRAHRLLNVTRDTGEFLSVLVRATNARRILEIGTSNGYSTLWLAEAAQATGGHVTTVELADYKVPLAAANFARAGLTACITQLHQDAAAALAGFPAAAWDLVFLDSERTDYLDWWPDIRRVLRPGGLLVVDNAVSHAGELRDFTARLRADPAFTLSLVPVGKGELLATRQREPEPR
jgi:predicted O-methyltransferase YrrM